MTNADPDSTEEILSRAHVLLAEGDRDGVLAVLHAGLNLNPTDGEFNALLADLLPAAALPHWQAAVAADPTRADWQRALAAAEAAAGEGAAAIARLRGLLARRGDDGAAHGLLARLLAAAGEREAALDHAREARFLRPHDLEALAALAEIWLDLDEPLRVAEVLDPALAAAHPLDPARNPAGSALGRAWLALSDPAKARTALEAAVAADETDPAGAAALLAGLDQGRGEALTPAFVRALFDQYADRFDRHLVGMLGYSVPALVGAAVADLPLPPAPRVLDAGCGTGLAGVELRGLAGWLEGFDLSPRMVEKAAARHIYDHLHVGELVEAFGNDRAGWDLIVAADVLVYLGDLVPVLSAAAQALNPGGYFVFSVERGEGEGFQLQESRRYRHGEDHLRSAVAGAGLELISLAPITPRLDRGMPIPGLLATLRK